MGCVVEVNLDLRISNTIHKHLSYYEQLSILYMYIVHTVVIPVYNI